MNSLQKAFKDSDDCARYRELLLRRDQLRKEARIYHGLYIKEFGDRMLELFERQIACIKKKKLIGYYQRAINLGGVIDQAAIDVQLAAEMAAYQAQLDTMIANNEAAKKITGVTEAELLKIKRLYRKLAKQLHPDINPKTVEVPELLDLWNTIVAAYNGNSLKDLEEAEVLVAEALEKLGLGITEIEIPDLPQKIAEVESEISHIRETDPYQYKYILEDPSAVEAKKADLDEQTKSYADYECELDGVIEGLLQSGVKIVWKMN